MMRQVSRFGWNFNKLQQLKMMLSSFFWPHVVKYKPDIPDLSRGITGVILVASEVLGLFLLCLFEG